MARPSLGRSFGWLWAAFAASTAGTWLGFGAFPLIAILVLDVGALGVSVLAAVGLLVGAVLAVPLGPWVEAHRKKPVMIAADVVRCGVLLTVPLAYALSMLTYAQLLAVSIVSTASNIAFTAASGAYLKQIVRPDHLLVANGRFESTTWTATAVGPTLGGGAISVLGPVVTVIANATGFLLSALSLGMLRDPEHVGPGVKSVKFRVSDVTEGWKFISADRQLLRLFWNTVAVNALIMATEPLIAVLLLDDMGWEAWQYGIAFGLPCIGGFVGARLATGLAARYGRGRVFLVSGALRAVWPVWLVLAMPGPAGVVLVIVVELALITCMGVFNPLFATARLERVPVDRIGRVMVAWNVTGTGAIAVLTGLWGLCAAITDARIAIGIAGALLLVTPFLLPGKQHFENEVAARGRRVPVASS